MTIVPAAAFLGLLSLAFPGHALESDSPAPQKALEGGQKAADTHDADLSGPRFIDNQDGTITDRQKMLMWKKTESYHELKKWLNWYMGQDYIKSLNEKRFAGYNDWRMPNLEELKSLYEENKNIPWKYYYGNVHQVHMDPIFGESTCCFWTSEPFKDIEGYAWGFNFIRGQKYPSPMGGPQLSLTATRPVRSIK